MLYFAALMSLPIYESPIVPSPETAIAAQASSKARLNADSAEGDH